LWKKHLLFVPVIPGRNSRNFILPTKTYASSRKGILGKRHLDVLIGKKNGVIYK
jgi:hypothetical protein